ncbi:hypothetical protein LX36DRAFT_346367 [Colletotrichum falcatum]|nr:hypothetical protein LX36DRAFT_346367 [Colletotrichum falcatum]
MMRGPSPTHLSRRHLRRVIGGLYRGRAYVPAVVTSLEAKDTVNSWSCLGPPPSPRHRLPVLPRWLGWDEEDWCSFLLLVLVCLREGLVWHIRRRGVMVSGRRAAAFGIALVGNAVWVLFRRETPPPLARAYLRGGTDVRRGLGNQHVFGVVFSGARVRMPRLCDGGGTTQGSPPCDLGGGGVQEN